MKQIEFEGKIYCVVEWQKPEDSDYGLGEVVYAIYPMKYDASPLPAVAQEKHRFIPLNRTFKSESGEIPQPLYVIGIPVIGGIGYAVKCPEIYNKIGDCRNETD